MYCFNHYRVYRPLLTTLFWGVVAIYLEPLGTVFQWGVVSNDETWQHRNTMEYLCQCHCKTARCLSAKSIVSSKEWIKFTEMHRKTICGVSAILWKHGWGLLYAYGLWLVQELQNCHLNLWFFFRLWHQTLHFKQRVPESSRGELGFQLTEGPLDLQGQLLL